MKKIILSLAICGFAAAYGQAVSDYQYIYVSKDQKDFENNQYGVNNALIKVLKSKKYEVSQDPAIQANACSFLTATINNTSSMLRNKVSIDFKDCKNNLVFQGKGQSMEKDFELGFADAIKNSLKELPTSNPKEITTTTVASTPILALKPAETVDQSKEVVPSVPSTSSIGDAKVFSNGKITVQKVDLSKDQFILVSGTSSTPYATFKSTAKADVYRVTLENGTSTLGYVENGNLVIEIPHNNDFIREVFLKRK